ncbi:hypothetical protein D3C80_1820700 [compost metagenome]
MFRHFPEQLVTCLSQFFVTQTALIDELEVKARCGTQFHDRRQVKGEHHRIFNL